MKRMPRRTAHFYQLFIEGANVDGLHENDLERYYHFIWAAHLGRAALSEQDVRARLILDEFGVDDADQLSGVYGHGRELLAARRTMPFVEREDWLD